MFDTAPLAEPLASVGTSASSARLRCVRVACCTFLELSRTFLDHERNVDSAEDLSSVEKLQEAVGRTFKAHVVLEAKGRVVSLRNSTTKLIRSLEADAVDVEDWVVNWVGRGVREGRQDLGRDLATAIDGRGASVTAAFSSNEEWLENMLMTMHTPRPRAQQQHNQQKIRPSRTHRRRLHTNNMAPHGDEMDCHGRGRRARNHKTNIHTRMVMR